MSDTPTTSAISSADGAPADGAPAVSQSSSDATLSPILFYCRDCKQCVKNPIRRGNEYAYECSGCHSERVSFGSRQAISEFYQVRP